jgi:carbonic anhydrase/acetyltransferase-like protein (isoleucine patch superfamily)
MNRGTAYIIRTEKRIAPFDDPVGEVLINQKTLGERQREALAELGFEISSILRLEEIRAGDYPCLLLSDDLFLNAATLREFLRLSQSASGSTQCAISNDTVFAKMLVPFQDEQSIGYSRFPLWNLTRANSLESAVTIIDIGEYQVPVSIPAHMRGSGEIIMPMILRPLVQINHPLDIIFASVTSLNVRFAEVLSSPARRALLGLRARSLNPARLLARMNKIGPGCEIHPTACLEGAEIGSRVQIGAHSVIRMSSIGDGCNIGDGSVIKHSVVGAGSVLFDDLTLGFAVCYPETFLIHGPYHVSLFGRSSAMFATILDDFRLDRKPIRIEVNGKLIPHPFPFIGSFIGHRTRVAGGSIISPGRSIPNDLLIFPASTGVLTRIPENLPRGVPLFIHNGGLEPVANLNPNGSDGKQQRSQAERESGAHVGTIFDLSQRGTNSL